MIPEDEVVMISAIEHFAYCPRQCALIHVEQIYDENVFTLRGTRVHERADTQTWESARDCRVERALPLWSEELGLNGRADIVEFREDGSIYPVEYKHGRLPRGRSPGETQFRPEDLQLCAQALCLEEMFHIRIEGGAIYHHGSRSRREVAFSAEIRTETVEVIAQIRELQREGVMPPPVNDSRCPNCSLNDSCVPAVVEEARHAWHLRDLYRPDNPES
jgi:CRISPR-associated exonuclease Cas4